MQLPGISADRVIRRLSALSLPLLLLLAACAKDVPAPVTQVVEAQTAPSPYTQHPAPVATQAPFEVQSPNGARPDPYYWLRDDSRSKPAVLEYLTAENEYAAKVTAHTRPLQEKLYGEIVGHIQGTDSSVPVLDRGWWYYSREEDGKQYSILARKRGSVDAPEQVMLDGNARAIGQDYYKVGGWDVSTNTQLLAWSEDTVGRNTFTLRFRNLETGELLADEITGVDDAVIWANDNKTVLYVEKDPVTLLGSRVRKHVLGTPQARDELVYEEADKSFFIGLSRSKTDQYLFIALSSTDVSEWRYAEASDSRLRFATFLPREPQHEYQIEHDGKDFIVRTNWQAPNFRLMRASVIKTAGKSPAAKGTADKGTTDKNKWQVVVPHKAYVFIEDFEVFKNWLAINERSSGLLRLSVKDLKTGREHFIKGDEPSCALSLVKTPQFDSDRVRVAYNSLATPETIYEYDLRAGEQRVLKREPAPGYDSAQYVTEFVFATARDGARIPISLVHRRDFRKDGTAPLLLRGYGSYGISSDPYFSPENLSLTERGFVLGIAHVRGGGEIGRQWYDEGRQSMKKNTFNDFVDATEYLVKQGYAAPGKVFAAGRSAGGLLMGAIANQRPDLYRGIIADVPFVDVVTTMLDDSIPLTTNEYAEWGDPRRAPDYEYMLSYSPYDQVKPQKYPAMLVTTGLWDSQVQYYEPAKWVARLRATRLGASPLVFKVNMEAGHRGKSGRYEQYRETAFEYAFMLDQLGITQ
jgi:oligopeptidase B